MLKLFTSYPGHSSRSSSLSNVRSLAFKTIAVAAMIKHRQEFAVIIASFYKIFSQKTVTWHKKSDMLSH